MIALSKDCGPDMLKPDVVVLIGESHGFYPQCAQTERILHGFVEAGNVRWVEVREAWKPETVGARP
jgi:hypothetical protein